MKMTTSSSGGNIDDEAFARIKMGVNVDIKRSDGKKERKKERKARIARCRSNKPLERAIMPEQMPRSKLKMFRHCNDNDVEVRPAPAWLPRRCARRL